MRYLYTLIIAIGLILSACGDDSTPTGPEPTEPTPNVDYSYTPESIEVGEEVTFQGEVKEGSSDIVTWEWNFGDNNGTTENGQTVTYTFENDGSYDVILTASDANGESVDVEKNIMVLDDTFEASIVWTYDTGSLVDNYNDASSPAIADDGTIYYMENWTGGDSKIIAISDNGNNAFISWETTTGARMRQAPAIGPDEDIYIGNWTVDAINKIDAENGNVLWNAPTVRGVTNSTAAIDQDGNVYFGTKGAAEAGFFSFGPNGSERWSITGVGDFYSSPAISNDGSTVYALVTSSGELHAINTSDGSLKWIDPVDVSSGLGTSLSIDTDGTIYMTTGSDVVAVTDNGDSGSVKWVESVTGPNESGVVIGPEGDLYTGSQDGLVSLNPNDGSINWIYEQIFVEESVPAVDNNGNVYIGSVDGRFSIVSPSGSLLKEFSLGNSVVNSPVIADDGAVYVEAMDNDIIKLFKINIESSEGPAGSNWPMKGQNRKNNGRS